MSDYNSRVNRTHERSASELMIADSEPGNPSLPPTISMKQENSLEEDEYSDTFELEPREHNVTEQLYTDTSKPQTESLRIDDLAVARNSMKSRLVNVPIPHRAVERAPLKMAGDPKAIFQMKSK